ncbi:MAG: hypothetical protein JSV08_10140 [Acidobacteriota bacterium]|nr:MAG: hypothetical protein JSV08_10140 [Acidobacteriota bacterium]
MADIDKLNALISSKVREAATQLVASLKGDLSQALERLDGLRVDLDETEVKPLLPSEPAPAPGEGASLLPALRRALLPIEQGRSQVNVLTPAVEQSAQFAARVALFVFKQDRMMGWKAFGFSGAFTDNDIKKIQVPVAKDTLFKVVRDTPCAYVGPPDRFSGNAEFLGKMGGTPTVVAGFPIVAKNRVAAILYADNGAPGGKLDPEALAVLTQLTGMAVDLISVRSKTPLVVGYRFEAGPEALQQQAPEDDLALDLGEEGPPPAEAPGPPGGAGVDEEGSFADEQPEAPAPTVISGGKEFELGSADVDTMPTPPPPAPPAAAPPLSPPPPPTRAKAPVTFTKGFDEELTRAAEDDFGGQDTAAVEEEISFEEPAAADEPQPAAADEPQPPAAAPVTQAFPAPGVEGEEHEEARRFARLLISEIKLYNEEKVTAGRKKRDIYNRLKDDIDRSLKVYKERIPASIMAQRDYFYEELVANLAGGIASALGDYPHKS